MITVKRDTQAGGLAEVVTHKEGSRGPCDAASGYEEGRLLQHTQLLVPDGHDESLERNLPSIQLNHLVCSDAVRMRKGEFTEYGYPQFLISLFCTMKCGNWPCSVE